jgi:transposase
MPTFAYVARDQAGQIRRGTSEAENESILRRRLQEQGFSVSKVKQSKEKSAAAGFGRIKLVDLAMFVEETFGVPLRVRQCQRLFRQFGFRRRKPRPVIAKADPYAQKAYKKTGRMGRAGGPGLVV